MKRYGTKKFPRRSSHWQSLTAGESSHTNQTAPLEPSSLFRRFSSHPLVILSGVIYPWCVPLCLCVHAPKSPLIPFICTAGIRIGRGFGLSSFLPADLSPMHLRAQPIDHSFFDFLLEDIQAVPSVDFSWFHQPLKRETSQRVYDFQKRSNWIPSFFNDRMICCPSKKNQLNFPFFFFFFQEKCKIAFGNMPSQLSLTRSSLR